VVLSAGDAASVLVQYRTQAELTAGNAGLSCPPTAGKTINGTVAGVDVTQSAQISLGGRSATVSFGSLNFQLTNVPSGAQDLVAYRHSFVGDPERAIIRRDLDIADNGSVGTLDFGGSEAFTPATATITVASLVAGETVSQSMLYYVGAICAPATLYSGATGGASFTASGIPGTQQRANDYHGLFVAASTSTNAVRSITEYFHTLAARTVTPGAAMPTPTITSLGGPYKRLQAAYTLPGDYQGATGLQYIDGVPKAVSIDATFGYLGGAATTLALPDFSALAGWDNNWAPPSASTGFWQVSGLGTFPGSACTEGASYKSATVSGTF